MFSSRFRPYYIVFVALALVACESTDNPVMEDDMPDVYDGPAGSVQGYIVTEDVGSGVDVVDDPANAQAGWSVWSGGELLVTGVTADVSHVTSDDGNGLLRIGNLPPGLYDAELRRDGDGATPDITVAFTVFADVTTHLGRRYAVSRDDAIAILFGAGTNAATGASAGAAAPPSTNALVLGMMSPLPAGSQVVPSFEDGSLARALTVDATSWFFMVDEHHNGAYGHEGISYTLVDAETGAMTMHDVTAPPRVNGGRMWSSDRDYFVYDGANMDSPETYNVEGAVVEATDEVVQLPPTPVPSPHTRLAPPPEVLEVLDNSEDIFALTLVCDPRSDFLQSGVDWMLFMESQGVAINRNHRVLYTPRVDSDRSLIEWWGRRNPIFDAIDERRAAGGEPTLIVYLSGHHTEDESGTPRRKVGWVFKDEEEVLNDIAYLGLTRAKPCRLIVILDTCHAAILGEDIIAEWEGLPENERPEIEVFASCEGPEFTFSYSVWQWAFSGGLLRAGMLFTNAIMDRATIADGRINGLTDGGGNLVAGLQELSTTIIGDTQHPVYFHLTGDPDWCKPPPLVTLDQDTLSYVHESATQPCNAVIGTVTLSNPSNEVSNWSVDTGSDAIVANPPAGTLNPGNSVVVTLYYNCSTLGTIDTQVTFTATNGGGTREDVATLGVGIRVNAQNARFDEFAVRAPGVAQIRTISLYIQVPLGAGAVVDSTKIVDTTTGEVPPLAPWAPLTQDTWQIVYEGPNAQQPDDYYGFRMEIGTIFSPGCPECEVLTWRYTVWYSFGGQQYSVSGDLREPVRALHLNE